MPAPRYFRLAVKKRNSEEIEKRGNKVFENHGFDFYSGLTSEDFFINIIYLYIANRSLEISELELINRGFAVVDTSNIPPELLEQVPCLICSPDYDQIKSFFHEKDKALAFLNKNLPLTSDSLKLYLKRK